MTKSQDKEAAAQELREREVLRRMLNTPPQHHADKAPKAAPAKKAPNKKP